MPQTALAEVVHPDTDANGCIPIVDPENGDYLGAVAPTKSTRLLDRMRPEVREALLDDIAEDVGRNEPIPLPVGVLERPAFPADLPPDHQDPDATVGLVDGFRINTTNNTVNLRINYNPYNLLTNLGIEQQATFQQWNVVLRDTNLATRMWATGDVVPIDNSTVWSNWNYTTTATTTQTYVTINAQVWDQWLTVTNNGTARQPLVAGTGFYQRPRTAEEIRANEERATEERARYAQMERDRDEATARATELLRANLDDEQEAELLTHARFHVRSQKGKLYRIRRGWSHSIDLMEDGVVKGTYCIHPREAVPNEDSMLVQKLMLESAEDDFLRIANFARRAG